MARAPSIIWDTAGNLLSRQDLKQSVTETFDYDALNRLTGSQRNGAQNLTLTYNAVGNLLTKSDVGSYTYHSTKKRAVIQAGSTVYGYDANGNMTSRGGSSISVTSYNLPSLMNQGSNSSAVSYGAFRNRFKQVTAGSDPTTTIYVAGILERVTRPGGVTEFRHQIHGPTGPIAIYTRRSSGTADTYYLHRDHLGSPELITNAAGTQVVKPSFAAFGERRGSTWTGTPSAGDWTAIGNTTRDGFTDHEHLDNVGLIHMNGRVYDPRVGRFLSKDPIVHVGLSQSPNSYSYAWNNPLRFVDPCGLDPLPAMPEVESWGRRPRGLSQQERNTLEQLRQQSRSAPSGGGGGGGGRAPRPDAVDSAEAECIVKCRQNLEPAVQAAAGAAGGGAAGLVLGGPKAFAAGAAIGGVVGMLSGAGASGAVTVPYAGAAGAAADMIVGGSGGMANPFSRGGSFAGLIGASAATTSTNPRTQVTLGASAAAYVDGIAAARGSGSYPTPYSSVSGIATLNTARAMALAAISAYVAYTAADWAATSICEGICDR